MKQDYNLNPSFIARANFFRRPARSLMLVLIVGLFAVILSGGTFLIQSLQRGMTSLSDRLGSDLVVVPAGYDGKVSGALLRGTPNNFYLPAGVTEEVRAIKGVKRASPQVFIATLSASCCSYPLQLIGFDAETDFIVTPWMKKQFKLPLKMGEVVVGANVVGIPGGQIMFFDKLYKIRGRLEKTGMGFDNSVFMSLEQARAIALDTRRKGEHPAVKHGNPVSVIMVDIESNTTIRQMIDRINDTFKGREVYALTTENIMREVSTSFLSLVVYLYSIVGLLWLVVFLVLALVFTIMFNERKREFALYRMLGAEQNFLFSMMIKESLYASIIGGIGGSIVGIIIASLFGTGIALSLKLPFLFPTFATIFILTFLASCLSAITGPLSAFFSARKLSKQNVVEAIQEQEA